MTPATDRAPRPTWTQRIAWAIATWFGCGRVPKAPGTMGTLGAIPLYLIVDRITHGGRVGVAVAAVLVTLIGVWAAGVVAHDIASKDPQIVVVDEVAGYLVTMIAAPHASWIAVVTGFVVFRAFDILKPWPIRRIEKLPGGWGIVMDDVAAGALGAAVLLVLDAASVLP